MTPTPELRRLRDEIAMRAMEAILTATSSMTKDGVVTTFAKEEGSKHCYKFADAMLQARGEEEPVEASPALKELGSMVGRTLKEAGPFKAPSAAAAAPPGRFWGRGSDE